MYDFGYISAATTLLVFADVTNLYFWQKYQRSIKQIKQWPTDLFQMAQNK